MATWPSKFCPLMGSYQESPADNLIRSSMDTGPAKIRKRSTSNTKPMSFNIYVRNEDMDEFDGFFNTDTMGGSLEFDFTHPRTKLAVKARFTSIPSYSDRSGKGFNVSIELEIMP